MCRNGTIPSATTTLSSTVRLPPFASSNLSGALSAATDHLRPCMRTGRVFIFGPLCPALYINIPTSLAFTGGMLTSAVIAQEVWRPKLPSPMPQPLVESELYSRIFALCNLQWNLGA